MATVTVAPIPAEEPSNGIERLLATALGEHWLTDCMGKLTPEQLESARNLAADHARNAVLEVRALGKGLGNTEDYVMEKDEVRRVAWAIVHLAEYADVCTTLVMMAEELSTPEGRDWQLEHKLSVEA